MAEETETDLKGDAELKGEDIGSAIGGAVGEAVDAVADLFDGPDYEEGDGVANTDLNGDGVVDELDDVLGAGGTALSMGKFGKKLKHTLLNTGKTPATVSVDGVDMILTRGRVVEVDAYSVKAASRSVQMKKAK